MRRSPHRRDPPLARQYGGHWAGEGWDCLVLGLRICAGVQGSGQGDEKVLMTTAALDQVGEVVRTKRGESMKKAFGERGIYLQ